MQKIRLLCLFCFVFRFRLSGLWLKLVLCISFVISLCVYPLCLSLWISLIFILSNVDLLEFVLKYRVVSPVIMAFLTCFGWYDFLCMYSCLFVFLMCVLISSIFSFLNLSPLYRIVSRNTSSLSCASYVNLIV